MCLNARSKYWFSIIFFFAEATAAMLVEFMAPMFLELANSQD